MSLSDADKISRLEAIAGNLGANINYPTSALSWTKDPESNLTAEDEQNGEAFLSLLRKKTAEEKPAAKGLKRMSTKSSKATAPYTHDEVYTALSVSIEESKSIAVFEVLLKKFLSLNGNINVARKAKGGVFRKLAKVDNPDERGNLLQAAAAEKREDFVQLLAPLADQTGRNEALEIALSGRDLKVIGTLLRHGT